MRLGAGYEEEGSQVEQQITLSIFQNIGPSIAYLKTDREDDYIIINSIPGCCKSTEKLSLTH